MKLLLAATLIWCILGCRERYPDTTALERARTHRTAATSGRGVIESGPPEAITARLTGGTLFFSDDFERDMLGPEWNASASTWKLVDGTIVNHHADNAGFWLLKELPEGDIRIEFDVRSDSYSTRKNGKTAEVFPGDLKCEAFNTKPKHQTGYVFIYGGWNNQINRIARLEEHGDGEGARVEDGVSQKVVAGQTYRMKVIRVGNTVAWYADTTYLAHMTDEDFISGRYFGFNNWRSHLTFDNVEVFALADQK